MHLFDDILRKGPASYLNCNIGEGFHPGLIKAYEASNKKEADAQVRLLCFSIIYTLTHVHD